MSSRESARRFQFLREIASGGFGSVYLAKVMHPDGFSRLAAVKLLHRRWTENEEVTRRMRDEARLLGWLRHRNIVDVVDLTSIDGRAAIVMEYLEAVDLKVIIRAATVSGDYVPPGAALQIAAYCASALDAAYNRPPYAGEKPLRVIHRDIKPSNIMVDESGMVKVLDFGVARAEFDTRESETRELQFGSVDYMPPERLFFEPDTPAADVYSLASTLYELLVLEKLGKAKMSLSKHTAFIEERLAYMRSCLGVSSQEASLLEDLLRSCLSFEPEHRPTSAEMVTHCRSLSRMFRGPGLAEWAETAIPPLIAAAREAPRKPNPLTDSVLTEDSLAFAKDTADEPAPPPPEPEPARASPPPGWNQPTGSPLTPIAAPVSEPEDVPTVRLSSEAIAEQIARASQATPKSSAKPSTLKPIDRSQPAESPRLELGPSDPWAVGGPRLVSVPLGPSDASEDEWADLPTRVDQPPLAPLDSPAGEDEIPPTVVSQEAPPAVDAQALKDAETVLLPDAIHIDALDEIADDGAADPGLFGDAAPPLPDEPGQAEPALFGGLDDLEDDAGEMEMIDDLPGPSDAPFSAGPLAEPPPAERQPDPAGHAAFSGPSPEPIAVSVGGDETAIFGPGEDAIEPAGDPEPPPTPMVYDPGPGAGRDRPPPPQVQSPMVFDPPPPEPPPAREEESSGGGLVRVLAVAAALILLGALGGGGFFVYKTFVTSPETEAGGATAGAASAQPPAGDGAAGDGVAADDQPADDGPAGGEAAGGADPAGEPITFISKAPNTKKLQINCTDGSAKGDTEAVIHSAGGRCRVTAIMEDRSRLTVVVDDASAGTYSCFAGGESVCTR